LIDKVVLGLRLSDERMRHREYKHEHLPASLRPTLAYALVWLSKIEATDTFLDPMCGAGTILIERAQAGRYAQIYGGDLRPEAVSAALTNIGNKYKPIAVQEWDARDLPFGSQSIDKIVSNLPFGKQIGSPEENQELYGSFLGETSRVLKAGGRAVFLTSEGVLFKKRLGRQRELKIVREERNIKVLGCLATIFVLEKK
jgi:23S rRNA G2445 N2-methylase RlmL